MTNIYNARLRIAGDPLIHYARRLESELSVNDSGATTCNTEYYVGALATRWPRMAKAVVVDAPVTCVICAINYTVWP